MFRKLMFAVIPMAALTTSAFADSNVTAADAKSEVLAQIQTLDLQAVTDPSAVITDGKDSPKMKELFFGYGYGYGYGVGCGHHFAYPVYGFAYPVYRYAYPVYGFGYARYGYLY